MLIKLLKTQFRTGFSSCIGLGFYYIKFVYR